MPVKAHSPTTPALADAFAGEVLADALSHRPADAGPAIVAISGLQGCGKTTLAAAVVATAQAAGLASATLSLDDVYLTAAQRRALAARVHPLLGTRGPPGTHDLALAHYTLDAIVAGQPLRLPRFDKLADDRACQDRWPVITTPLDVLVVEGWCLGVPAEDAAALATPLNVLERDEDPQGQWRAYCNDALHAHYPSLWRRFHRLWVLQSPSFEIVSAWRWQQEQALVAASPTQRGMDRAQLGRFLQHYERVSRHALRTLPTRADRVLWLDEARQVRDAR